MSSSVLQTLGSAKIQNLLLVLTGGIGVVTWVILTGIFYTPPPPSEMAEIVLLIASGALLGLLPIASVRAETAGCQNLLRILIVVLISTLALYLFYRGMNSVYTPVFVGSVAGLLGFGYLIDKFKQEAGTVFVFVWQFILIGYVGFLYWFVQSTLTAVEAVLIGTLVLMTLSLFAFHRSLIIERKRKFQN